MLHAQASLGSVAWIVSLVNDQNELCVLHVCTNEVEAKTYAQHVNTCIIPHQKSIVNKLAVLQSILTNILEKAGIAPKTPEEVVLAVRQIIKYIEVGRFSDKN